MGRCVKLCCFQPLDPSAFPAAGNCVSQLPWAPACFNQKEWGVELLGDAAVLFVLLDDGGCQPVATSASTVLYLSLEVAVPWLTLKNYNPNTQDCKYSSF